MLSGSAETKRDSKGAIWYKVVKLEGEAPASTPALTPADARSMKQIMDGLFPCPKEIKYKRLIETAIAKEPSELHMGIVKSFEGRVKRENPQGELGLLSALDISIQEAKQDFEEKQSEQGETHDDSIDPDLGF